MDTDEERARSTDPGTGRIHREGQKVGTLKVFVCDGHWPTVPGAMGITGERQDITRVRQSRIF